MAGRVSLGTVVLLVALFPKPTASCFFHLVGVRPFPTLVEIDNRGLLFVNLYLEDDGGFLVTAQGA